METLTRIYIFFIGIIALLVCFITWASIKLRAERIRRIRAERIIGVQTKWYQNRKKLYSDKIESYKDSIDTLNTLIEGNKVLLDSKESQLVIKEGQIETQRGRIGNLESQIKNLSKCIERTGIRGTDGVVRKCNAGHIQSVISGTHAILNKPEKKGKNKEELKECAIEIDGKTQLRKYDPMKNAFPVDYKEKAEEFIEKFAPVMPNEDWKEKARQCALIAVDEVLKAFDTEWAKLEFWTEELGDTTKYWQQVKLEIQTL